MPVVNLPDATYERLVELAAEWNVSIEVFISSYIVGAFSKKPSEGLSQVQQERLAAFERMTKRIESEVGRYPPGYRADDSRESIYKEREDAQL